MGIMGVAMGIMGAMGVGIIGVAMGIMGAMGVGIIGIVRIMGIVGL